MDFNLVKDQTFNLWKSFLGFLIKLYEWAVNISIVETAEKAQVS